MLSVFIIYQFSYFTVIIIYNDIVKEINRAGGLIINKYTID